MDRPAGKVLARPQVDGEGDFVDRVAAIVGNRALVTRSGTADLAEIGPAGVTKATAVRDWCAARGIGADDVWAFGDMPNDVPLLLWAGHSFAVAGAHHEARAAADNLCGANSDDGVAAVLEQMLLL
jgi:hydroxymethylpyrimidine pyrophosphatase-like HAD family hydrolase